MKRTENRKKREQNRALVTDFTLYDLCLAKVAPGYLSGVNEVGWWAGGLVGWRVGGLVGWRVGELVG